MYSYVMIIKWIRKKFDQWRQEPEHVRIRIATLLTVGSGATISLLWLFVLLPVQLKFDRPSQPKTNELAPAAASAPKDGVVSGIQDVLPSPSATPQYYNGTRPGFRTEMPLPSPASPSPTPTPTPESTGGLPVTE